MKITVEIIGFIIGLTVMYLLCGFIAMDWDIINYNTGARAVTVIVSILVGTVTGGVSGMSIEEKNKVKRKELKEQEIKERYNTKDYRTLNLERRNINQEIQIIDLQDKLNSIRIKSSSGNRKNYPSILLTHNRDRIN